MARFQSRTHLFDVQDLAGGVLAYRKVDAQGFEIPDFFVCQDAVIERLIGRVEAILPVFNIC